MKFKSISRWVVSEELAGLLFFAQRMDELLWNFTLDTYKPSALNSPYLCQEALALIVNIEQELIDDSNLFHVLEEIVWSIKNDPVAKKLMDLPIENYINLEDNGKLSDKKIKIDALFRSINPFRYLNQAFNDLALSVISGKKKEIDYLSRTVVTTLINMGVSKQSIAWKVNKFFFAIDAELIDDNKKIYEFLDFIYPYSHEFDVYLKVGSLVKEVEESLDAFSIELIDDLDEELEKIKKSTDDFELNGDEIFAHIGPFRALDVYSAHAEAVRKLDQVSDLFTLFHHRTQISWGDKAIVKQCCLDKPVITKLNKGPMDKPFDFNSEKASKELNRLLRNFSLKGASRARFNRVTDLHGICVSADVVDNQLVTLWTSLETLIPSKAGMPKIANIINSALPFLLSHYVYRIVQRFSFDLLAWKPWLVKRILAKVPDSPSADFVHKCFSLLAVKENKMLRDELYEQLKDFHLLRFRAFQLSEMLSKKEKIRNMLESHEKKIKWQLRRIYRTRNLLVHSGAKTSYIHTLVENSHDYLDQIIYEIMRISCSSYQASTLEQVFEISKIKYKKIIQWLQVGEEFSAKDFLVLKLDSESLGNDRESEWIMNFSD